MRGILISAVVSTAVTAGLSGLAAELTAADGNSAARDRASAARQQADADRDVSVGRNEVRSYLQRSWSSTSSQQSEDEISAQTSVAVGNTVSTQTATTSTSGGKASISLSTTVRTSQGGETITRVQRATANTTVD
jgi:MoxR-like ATPase